MLQRIMAQLSELQRTIYATVSLLQPATVEHIQKHIRVTTQLDPSIGRIYIILDQLEATGYVSGQWTPMTADGRKILYSVIKPLE